MKYLPKLQQLKAFQQVIRSGSIRGAARAMNQSQPAVSRSLKELEQTLDTQLIVRGNQGMVLTDTGRAFAQRMQFILEELERAAIEIQQMNQYSQGSVAMGCSSLLTLTVFPALAGAFTEQFPQAKLTVKEGQLSTLLPALREGRLDFAVGSAGPGLPLEDLIREPLFRAPFGILARRGHPLEQATTLAEVQDARWVFPETDMGYYRQLQMTMIDFYQSCQTPLRTDSVVCGLNMVLQADYLTVVARAMYAPFGLQDKLRLLDIDTLPDADFCVFYSQKSPLTFATRRFLELLRLKCQEYRW